MKNSFLAKFLATDEGPEVKAAPEPRDTTHLITVPVSVFDGVNKHLSELVEAEAMARAAHQASLQALAKFKSDMKAQYEAQLAAINTLFPGDNHE